MRKSLFLILMLLATNALAFDPAKAPRYPSPDMYRPNVDSIILRGNNSSGDISTMSVKPTGAAVAQTLADLMAQRLNIKGNDLSQSNYAGLGPYITFGNTDALNYLYSHRNGTQPSLLGTAATVRNTAGSGTFGPVAADFAHMFATQKDNWSTATGSAALEGEIDPVFVITNQGKKGDTAGLLVNATKRRDNLTTLQSDETGAPSLFEGSVSLTDASGNIYHNMHSILGFAESPLNNPGGPNSMSGGRGFGSYNETFLGTWFSAFHASSVSTATGWQNYFSGATTRDPATINYRVDNNGIVYSGFPAARVSYGYDANADAMLFKDQAGATIGFIGRTSKVWGAIGGIQIGVGAVQAYLNAKSGTATIPANMASLAVADVTTLAITGAQPGDMVTVSTVIADSGLSGYRLFGVVTAAGVVTIRAQNLNPTTAGGTAISFTAKVERFQ
ncbi:hypothetical protein PQI07_22445 [Methylobacterium sp. 092160098-2]|uniref:hypothetical protein n=1 Tax=Methylobacterium sp. 092160098-2 TaxID=3025129 RepID=UPI002381B978|nr:hypothetical protein [Methylobacterium sp. 092160098-2]MDE4913443.1 hypothetical protein [Methylobacterium sp. 092160098-2]